MAEERVALAELLEKAGEDDFLRIVAEAVLQLLMEADVDGMIGASRYERSGERTTSRIGFPRPQPRYKARPAAVAHSKLRQGELFSAVPGGPQGTGEGAG